MFHVVGGMVSVRLIRTIDLIDLNPYFHGTTSRIGAPFCFGASARRKARSQESSADASPRPDADPRGRAIPESDFAGRTSPPGAAGFESHELGARLHAHADPAGPKAETRSRARPSTRPRHSGIGRCVPPAADPSSGRQGHRYRACRPSRRSRSTRGRRSALPA
jgi:hypothetical protein